MQHIASIFSILLHKKDPLRSLCFVLQPEWTSQRASCPWLTPPSVITWLLNFLCKVERVDCGNCLLGEEGVSGWPVVNFPALRGFSHKTNMGLNRVKVCERSDDTSQNGFTVSFVCFQLHSRPVSVVSFIVCDCLAEKDWMTRRFKWPLLEKDENITFKDSQLSEGIPSWRVLTLSSHSFAAPRVNQHSRTHSSQKGSRESLSSGSLLFWRRMLLPRLSCHWNRAASAWVALNTLTWFQETS